MSKCFLLLPREPKWAEGAAARPPLVQRPMLLLRGWRQRADIVCVVDDVVVAEGGQRCTPIDPISGSVSTDRRLREPERSERTSRKNAVAVIGRDGTQQQQRGKGPAGRPHLEAGAEDVARHAVNGYDEDVPTAGHPSAINGDTGIVVVVQFDAAKHRL